MMEVVAQQSDNSIFLRCLVVDDEPMAREGMIDLISKVGFFNCQEFVLLQWKQCSL